jgi:Fe-S cluster assembly protein SufD
VKDLEPYMIAGLDAHLLVWVDGAFNAELSSAGEVVGVSISRISESAQLVDAESAVGSSNAHSDDAFAALATALMTDGISLTVARGASAVKPIHIVHVATAAAHGSVMAPRLVVDAAETSQVSIIESHVALAAGSYLSLPVAEIRAAQGAVVDYVKFQNESRDAFHVSMTAVDQGRDATVRTYIFSFGGALVRNNATVALNGSGSNAVLNGLSVLSGSQHVDNTTLIHHIEPSAESREHFKGIYADESRGVFSGTITVEKIAQKTNAFQSNQTLLLSPTASIETRPQLKIWADDVKCTHGATVGQLDADALFYLRSRGIDRDIARNFLIHAFASEVLTSVESVEVRGYIEGVLSGVLDTLARV